MRIWVWSFPGASGRSRSLPHVSGIKHAEEAFVDGACSLCGDMIISELHRRLRYVKHGGVPLPLPQSGVRPGTRGAAASGGVRGDLRITVRASPRGVPHPSSTPQPVVLPLERAGTSAEQGSPPVSFGAPPDDQMSIAASEGEEFFPEVHEELTRSRKAPFTARNKSCGSSPLTTLDGGAALGYTGIPSVEQSVAMQLCPTAATTLQGEPCLPSRACKYSSEGRVPECSRVIDRPFRRRCREL